MHALRFIHVYIHVYMVVIHELDRNVSASGEVYRAHY